MTTPASNNRFKGVSFQPQATPATPATGDGRLFLDTADGLLKWIDDAGVVTEVIGGGGVTDHGALTGLADDDHTQYVLRSILTTNGDLFTRAAGAVSRLGIGSTGDVLTVSGGAPTWAAPAGGSGLTASFLGYNTVGGSIQTMTQKRVYAKQITAGGSGNYLLGIQAYLDQTVEAALAISFFLHADSGSDTIGDLLVSSLSNTSVFAHGTGGGISYPARWVGMPIGYPLTASTKYWVGVVYNSGTGAPRLYYDGSGSDRYYDGGATPYYNDGAYGAGSQTNTTNKHSIRALVLG